MMDSFAPVTVTAAKKCRSALPLRLSSIHVCQSNHDIPNNEAGEFVRTGNTLFAAD
ncbi:hypothetical protein BDR03DRAFT_964243 [Suillus americanus]|nr:hypothetical protein BDR03DRAFT_964243 [Suillus americanus]